MNFQPNNGICIPKTKENLRKTIKRKPTAPPGPKPRQARAGARVQTAWGPRIRIQHFWICCRGVRVSITYPKLRFVHPSRTLEPAYPKFARFGAYPKMFRDAGRVSKTYPKRIQNTISYPKRIHNVSINYQHFSQNIITYARHVPHIPVGIGVNPMANGNNTHSE